MKEHLRFLLHLRVPPRVEQENVVRLDQGQAESAGLEGDEEDVRLARAEGVDGRVKRGGADGKRGSDPQNGGKNESAEEGGFVKEGNSVQSGRQSGSDAGRPLEELVSEIEAEVRRFFCGLLSGRALEQNEGGVLTLFNHRGFSTTDRKSVV